MKRHIAIAATVLMSLGAGPATTPATDYPAMRQQLLSLTAEVQRLTTENATLQAALAKANATIERLTPKQAGAASLKPASTFSDRAETHIKNSAWLKPSKAEVDQIRRDAKAIDDKLTAYLAAHPEISPEVAAALFEGRPAVGMREDELAMIVQPYRGSPVETANSKEFTCVPLTAGSEQQYRVGVSNGIVSIVSRIDVSRAPNIPH